MLHYFNKIDNIDRTIVQFGDNRLLQETYLNEIYRLQSYMSSSSIVAPNDILLVKAVKNMAPTYTLSIEEYYSQIVNNIRQSSSFYGFVTNDSFGKIVKDNFYSKNSTELYVRIENNKNIIELENWKNLRIISTIYTENTNINFYTRGLKDLEYFNKFTIFGIDLIELLVAYKFWCEERYLLNQDTDATHFIAKHVYPKVWETMLDMTILNRYIKKYLNIPIADFSKATPYTPINYVSKIDKYLENVVKHNKKSKIQLNQMLNNVLWIMRPHTENLFIPPLHTLRYRYILWLSRIGLTRIVYDMMLDNRSYRLYLDDWGRFVYMLRKYINGWVMMPTFLPNEVMIDYEASLEYLKHELKV